MEDNKTIDYCSNAKLSVFVQVPESSSTLGNWKPKFLESVWVVWHSHCVSDLPVGTKPNVTILIDWVKRWTQAVTFRWQRLTPQRLTEHLVTVNLPQSIYIGPISVRFRTTYRHLVSGTKGTPRSDSLRTIFCFGSHAVTPIWSRSISTLF